MTLRLRNLFVVLLVFSLLYTVADARVNSGQEAPKPYIIPGSIVVEFTDNIVPQTSARGAAQAASGIPSIDMILDKYQALELKEMFPWRAQSTDKSQEVVRMTRTYQISLPETVDVEQIRDEIKQNPNVVDAHLTWAMPVTAIPDDPDYTDQWHRTKLQLENAWDLEAGSDNVIIAIIDTGVNYEHGDLINNIWVNPGEDLDGDGVVYDLDDLNGIDDDGNGIADDLIGYDFLSFGSSPMAGEDGSTPDTDPNDFDGHGTHCAGIAAAVTNNATDVIGLAGGWAGGHRSYRGVRIMCLRVGWTGSDGNGYVNSTNCAQAIDYAVANGAQSINMSWGGSSAQTTAIANAITNGLTLVHAAGNDDNTIGDALDNFGTAVLSVASTTSSDVKSDFSNYGSWVDVSAPGSQILSTYSNQYAPTTEYLWGTSMAAPMVVGLSALIRSQMPSLNKFQVDSIIMQTTDDHYGVNPGYVGELGTGRINVFRALDTLANARFSSTETDGQVPHEVTFTDESPKNPTSWTWDFGDGNGSTDQNPVHTYTSPGVYDVSLVVTDDNGLGEEHLQRYVWARADTLNIAQVEGDPGTTVEVPISLTNTALVKDISVTFTIPNSFNVKPNGLSVVGTRCEDFDNVNFIGFDNFNKRYSVFLNSSGSGESNYLQPGSGPIVKILFDVPAAVPPQTILNIDTTSWNIYYNGVTTVLGDYFPAAYAAGSIEITGCCLGGTGNVNFDPADNVDISDLTKLVNHLFVTFESLECPEEANTNGDVGGNIDISDLTKLVNHLFVTFETLADCQ